MTLTIERTMKRKINEVLDVEEICETKKYRHEKSPDSFNPVEKTTKEFWGNYFDQQLEREWNELQDNILDELAQEIDDFLQKDITSKLNKMSIVSKNGIKVHDDHDDEYDFKPIQDLSEKTSVAEVKLSRKQGKRRRTYAVCCNDSTDTEDETGENSLKIK